VSIYAIVLDGGYRTLIFKEGVSKSAALNLGVDELLGSALGHVLIFSLIGILLATLITQEVFLSSIAAVLCFSLISVSTFLSSKLKASGEFSKEAVWQVVVRTLTAGLVFLSAYFLSDSIPLIFFAWGLGIVLALMLPLARGIRIRPSIKPNFPVLKSCIMFITIDAATILYFRSDIVMLGFFDVGNAVVGKYSAATKILEGIILMMSPVAHIAFRSMRLKHNDKSGFFRLFKVLMFLMVPVSLIIVTAGLLLSGSIITFVFGEEFGDAGVLLFWILMALFFILPNYIATQAAIALNLERYYALAAISAAALNIAINVVLIPIYGAIGAAWSTIATEAFLFGFLLLAIAGNSSGSGKETVV
jgi:O-antigen/teichoic acid export membrane protein